MLWKIKRGKKAPKKDFSFYGSIAGVCAGARGGLLRFDFVRNDLTHKLAWRKKKFSKRMRAHAKNTRIICTRWKKSCERLYPCMYVCICDLYHTFLEEIILDCTYIHTYKEGKKRLTLLFEVMYFEDSFLLHVIQSKMSLLNSGQVCIVEFHSKRNLIYKN